MAGDPLAPVAAGTVSPFVTSERTVNAALERLRAIGAPERAAPVGGAYPVAGAWPQVTVFVRNDTGSTLPAFAVVNIGDPLVSAVDNPHDVNRTPTFQGLISTSVTQPFAICLTSAKPNEIVRATMLGCCVGYVTYSDAGHTSAIPPIGSVASMDSAASGPAKIIWSAGTSGTQIAVLLLQGDSSGGSGTVTSVGLTHTYGGDGTPGLVVTGSPVTTSGTLDIALSGDLLALESITGTGNIYYRAAADTWSAVTIGTGLSFSSGTLSATGGSGTVTSVGITAPAAGLSASGSPVTTSGNITLALANDLAALEALTGTNTIYYRSGSDTWSPVTIGSNLTFSGGTLSATGGGGTVTSVGITAPAAGISVSGSPVTSSGNITLALANDLAALESFAGTGATGIPVRTASDTWGSLTLGSFLEYTSATLNVNSPITPGGRLTLATGDPVPTANSGASVTTIYYTPYLHNLIQLWDGTVWKTITFSEVSNAPSIPAASRPRDVFAYLDDGSLAIETNAWTNDTTRATAIVYDDGRLIKSGDKTRLYLGTVRTKSDGYFMDSESQRFVWNMYNRVPKSLLRQDATASWNYTTATWRSANNSTGNRVEVVVGQAGQSLRLEYIQASANGTPSVQRRNGIGEDSTTANSAKCGIGVASNSAATSATAILSIMPTVGYHYYQMLEWSTASGTSTWFGLSTDQLCQLSGEWLC